jgi:integrase
MTERRQFGSVAQLPSGRFQARYRGPDGKRYPAKTAEGKPLTFATEVEADRWLTGVSVDIDRGTWKPPAAVTAVTRVTLASYAESWLKTRELAPNTRHQYVNYLLPHLLERWGDVELSDITPTAVRTWYADLLPGRKSYRAHVYSLLRTLLKGAVDDRVIDHNPCTVRGGGSNKRQKRIEPASLPELAVIVENVPDRLRLMVMLAAWCACRFEEVSELRRRDIHLAKGTLRVERACVIIGGERIVGPPKSEAGVRTVAIPPHLTDMIAAHLIEHAQDGRDGLLFPDYQGRQMNRSSMARHFNRARKVAGREDVTFHGLRHTGAVLAAATGATVAELMARLGHSTPSMAMRYQHAAQDRDRAIADALSKLAAG